MSGAPVDAPAAGAAEPPPPVSPPAVRARPPRLWRTRRWIASLNPASMFFGPVFQRDVRMLGRRKSTYWLRLVAVALPALLIAMVFMATTNGAMDRGSGSAAGRIQSLQAVATSVAVTITWCQLIILALIGPLLTAGSIVEERAARALSAIATSPITAGAIIGGSFLSRLAALLTLSLLSVPLLLAVRTFGGLEPMFVIWSWAIGITAGTATCAAGLWASTRATRPAGAVFIGISLVLALWGGPVLFILVDSALQGWREPSTLAVLILSPPVALAMQQEGMPPGAMFGLLPWSAAATNCAWNALVTLVMLWLARQRLAWLIHTDQVELVRPVSRRARRQAALAAAASPATDTERISADHPSPGPAAPRVVLNASSHTSRTVKGNPLLWRELRQSVFSSTWQRWLALAGIGLALFLTHALTLRADGWEMVSVVIVPAMVGLALMLFAAAAVPAGSITAELEARTWGVLLTTPLSPHAVLLPKVVGAMSRLWPAPVFVILHLSVCVLRGSIPPGALVFAAVHCVVLTFFLCATGVTMSMLCRKSATAGVLNLGLALGLWLVGPIFLGIAAELFRAGHGSIGVVMLPNPAGLFGFGLAALAEGDRMVDYFGMRISQPAFFVLWGVVCAVYAAAGALILVVSCSRLRTWGTARA